MSSSDGGGGGVAVRGASLLILLQVTSRAITFVANQVLLRYLTASLLGVSAQLEAYHLSVLFFARESLRVAIQRQQGADPTGSGSGSGPATQALVNAAYVPVLLGSIAAPLLGWLYLSSSSSSSSATTPGLALSTCIFALAAVAELLTEPAFAVAQRRQRFAVRARAEAAGAFARCAVTLAAAVVASRRGLDVGVLPFALGQAGYAAALMAVYGWYGAGLAREEGKGEEGFSLLPARIVGAAASGEELKRRDGSGGGGGDYVLSYFYRPTLQLASSMMLQSLVKHVLTQGDTFLVSVLSTPTAQGVYALANNYGGLVARLVLQPIEESSRTYFSRVLASTADNTSDETRVVVVVAAAPERKAVVRARADLQSLLRVYLLLSLVVTALGPAAAPRLLSLVAGSHWVGSGAGSCLSTYVWYIPLLAVNGVSEAFVASVATEAEVHRQSAWMTAFSLVFAGAGFVSLRVLDLGAVGLVWANGINMTCRIVWCAAFIARYFGRLGEPFDIQGILPGPWGVLASVVTSQVIRTVVGAVGQEPVGPKETLVSLVKIAGIAVPYLGVLALSERKFLLDSFQTIRGHRRAKS
ncbi:oligosaccharide translocation protein RFT1, variant [Phialemonium atrogriseum]|uniref:Man(5)GlcNAc(2)-PP-dolichol translocation protein RFT1 n=1 Tax=Phialemonium atrogriseum TaxID=1093897 RepID=A0AAJ0BQI8_9PEZI|nr:oligosaccharide translocation protein RFT1, variant [Phialemonium atrogriseum]KAK1762624.1 oligosaccharide translocation protein RFT1, variant [Phialemonium atrogriseum]